MRSILIAATPIAFGLCIFALPASAAMMNGQSLAHECAASDELCAGYIAGVLDQWGGMEASVEKLKKCFADGLTLPVLVGTVKTYMEAHVDQLSSTGPVVVIAALEDAMAC